MFLLILLLLSSHSYIKLLFFCANFNFNIKDKYNIKHRYKSKFWRNKEKKNNVRLNIRNKENYLEKYSLSTQLVSMAFIFFFVIKNNMKFSFEIKIKFS